MCETVTTVCVRVVQVKPTRMTVGEIFEALGCAKPYCDSAGVRLRPALLQKRFMTGFNDLAHGSGQRKELLTAASALTHAVLSLLAPDPLSTSAALATPRLRCIAADPLRHSLVQWSSKPKGRQLAQLVADSPLAQSLIKSYIATVQRKEPMAVRAQILSPLTAQYSLRLFNECFSVQLEGNCGPVTTYSWRYARWHAAIWLAAQTAIATSTPTWRLKEHSATLEALAFLTSSENLQHKAHGVRRVRNSKGDWVELPKTERVQCPEMLWVAFEARQPKDAKHVKRSRFVDLAKLVADTEQKSYGALDTFAEHNGRLPAKLLRELTVEIVEAVEALGKLYTNLPASEAAVLQSIAKHASALKDKVSWVENFIKYELSLHVPSCDAPEPADDVETCPERCRQCAFGSDSDPSRAWACCREHTKRCPSCADAHSLQFDFHLLFQSVSEALGRAKVVSHPKAAPWCEPCCFLRSWSCL